MKKSALLFAILIAIGLMPFLTNAAAPLSGKFLVNSDKNGEAYYYMPANLISGKAAAPYTISLGNPKDAFETLKRIRLGISESDFTNIDKLKKRLAGAIVMRLQGNEEVYYINPSDLSVNQIASGTDVLALIQKTGITVKQSDLDKLDHDGVAIDAYRFFINKHEADPVDRQDLWTISNFRQYVAPSLGIAVSYPAVYNPQCHIKREGNTITVCGESVNYTVQVFAKKAGVYLQDDIKAKFKKYIKPGCSVDFSTDSENGNSTLVYRSTKVISAQINCSQASSANRYSDYTQNMGKFIMESSQPDHYAFVPKLNYDWDDFHIEFVTSVK
ncbi:MAG: hypothetical protein WCO55_05505 [Candidatus Falkowbacteria bacterium]